jgi:putative ABC transport system permease protein
MLKLTLRNLGAHKRRLIGTSLAVCLGVAFLAGTFVLSDTLRANFDRLFTSSLGQTDAVVRNADRVDGDIETASALVPPSVVEEIADVDGVAASVPSIEGFGQLNGADGEKIGGFGPPTIAGNWIEDPDLNPYRLVEGRAPRAPDEVVINRGAANDGDLEVGDTTTVETPTPVEVRIVGLATFGDEDGFGPSTFTAFTLEGAREHVLGGAAGATSVLVRAENGVSPAALADRLSAALGDGVEVTTGADFVDEANESIDADFLGFLRTFLGVFGGVALLVAAFSINNTFSILIAQRTRESALLRAVGASRRQVFGSMLVETLLVGVVASAIGVAAGIGIAVGLKAVFDAFGFSLPAGGLTLTSASLVVAPLVGLIATLVAGLGPALRGSGVPPLAALRDVATERTSAGIVRVVSGLLLTGGGVVLVVTAALAGGEALPRAGLGALLTVVGTVVLGPVVAGRLSGALGRPVARWRGVAGRLARRNAMRNPRRTSATAAALLVGVGVVTLFTVFAASLKASIDKSVEDSFAGDLVITAGGFSGGLSPELATTVAGLPEVGSAVGVGSGQMRLDGDSTPVSTADPATLATVIDLDVGEGSMADLGPNQLAVAAPVAEDEGWTIGTPVASTFPDGRTVDLRVGALYETRDLFGDVIVPRATWDRHAIQSVDVVVLVKLADGVSLHDGKVAAQAVADRFGRPDVQDEDEYVQSVTERVNALLGLIYVMLVLAIVIALMGIANALSMAIHERTRELGLLRAVGTTRRQVRSMVRWESVLIAVLGVVGGVGVGLFLGWALVQAAAGSGAINAFAVPVGQLVVVMVVGAVAGALAALRPARRAARLDVLEAIAV